MTNKNLTLIKNADLIISMDDARRVLNNYDILISDGQIQKVEKTIRLNGLEKVIDQNSKVPTITDIIYSPDIYIPILAFFSLVLICIFLRRLFYKS